MRRRWSADLAVPVYLAEGRFEPRGRKDLARDCPGSSSIPQVTVRSSSSQPSSPT